MPTDVDITNDGDGGHSALECSALLGRWLDLCEVDLGSWIDAAIALPDGVWTDGGFRLGGEECRPSFRRRGGMIDARIERDGIAYAMIGTLVSLVVTARWPATVVTALTGRNLEDVVETPITRGIPAGIVSASSFGGAAGIVMIVAAASTMAVKPALTTRT